MKNNILFHKNSSVKKILLKYILVLCPLIFYGFYKNGVILYTEGLISLSKMFIPLIFPVIGSLCGLLASFIKEKKLSLNWDILEGIIIGMIVPLNTNIFLFVIVVFILLYISKFIENKININKICFIKLIIIGLLIILSKYSYLNANELTGDYAYTLMDTIFGRQVSGIANSSLIWIAFGFLILLFDYYYKKEIPIYAILTYTLLTILISFLLKDLNILNNLLAGSVIFAFVFVAPLSKSSCYSDRGKIASGILIGLITSLLNLILNINETAIIAILLISLVNKYIDRLFTAKKAKL